MSPLGEAVALAVVPESLSAPEPLPMATVRYARTRTRVTCQVLVDGSPAAELPVSGIEFTHDLPKVPKVKLLLLAEDVEVGTLDTGRGR